MKLLIIPAVVALAGAWVLTGAGEISPIEARAGTTFRVNVPGDPIEDGSCESSLFR